MWDELYEKHFPELIRYAFKSCRSRELAEDLAQEAFLKALQNADVFEDLSVSQKRAWLYRTLKNLIVDRFRRDSFEERYMQTMQTDAATEWGFEETENRTLLQALPAEDRVFFQMRYLEGYNASELAEIFHIPPGTVRAKLSRSKKKLKFMLSQK